MMGKIKRTNTLFGTVTASAALTFLLAGCVTSSPTDLTEAVREALEPAIDTFFDEFEKRLSEQSTDDRTLVFTGYATPTCSRSGHAYPAMDFRSGG